MTASAQMRRLEALEAAAQAERLEADLDEQRSQIAEWAKRIGIPTETLMQDIREDMLRIAEVGEAQWNAEQAAEFGCTVDELLSGEFHARLEREWADSVCDRRARQRLSIPQEPCRLLPMDPDKH